MRCSNFQIPKTQAGIRKALDERKGLIETRTGENIVGKEAMVMSRLESDGLNRCEEEIDENGKRQVQQLKRSCRDSIYIHTYLGMYV